MTTRSGIPSRGLVLRSGGQDLRLVRSRLHAVVGGYTGRDPAAVQRHVDELASIGVPAPPRIPMFYPISPTSVTSAATVAIDSMHTSGEVEPVLIRCNGRMYLGVGSDHTDRDAEAADVGAAKRACPKPIGTELIAIADLARFDWDSCRISSWVDGVLYQDSTLSELTRPEALLSAGRPEDGLDAANLVCFCGTVPLLSGAFAFGTSWRLELTDPDGRTLRHTYAVERKER